jgi:hypothetical protein
MLFNDALDGASKALVLTEGLLTYLEDRDVVALSEAIKRPEVTWWMLEFAFPGLKKMRNKKMAAMLQNAPFKLAPENAAPAGSGTSGSPTLQRSRPSHPLSPGRALVDAECLDR